jgi:hypothetical protein
MRLGLRLGALVGGVALHHLALHPPVDHLAATGVLAVLLAVLALLMVLAVLLMLLAGLGRGMRRYRGGDEKRERADNGFHIHSPWLSGP